MKGKGNLGTMGTGTKHGLANSAQSFGKMKSETSNMVKGKSSKTMNVKGNGSDKKQGKR